MHEGKPVIFFDGVCNLCNKGVQFVIRHDKKRIFRFASLQGKAGQELLSNKNFPSENYRSVVLRENEKIYTRSAAALRILSKMRFPWNLLTVFWVIPKFLRDIIYDWVAGNRYKWFGKKEACMVPAPDQADRFVD